LPIGESTSVSAAVGTKPGPHDIESTSNCVAVIALPGYVLSSVLHAVVLPEPVDGADIDAVVDLVCLGAVERDVVSSGGPFFEKLIGDVSA
jgi:hypothetical protein